MAPSTAAVWAQAGIHPLPTLGGRSGFTSGINDHGQIAGGSQDPSGTFRPTLWSNGTAIRLELPGGGRVADINDCQQLVGEAPASGTFRAMRWRLSGGR